MVMLNEYYIRSVLCIYGTQSGPCMPDGQTFEVK